jgi:hypothetical protein
MDLHNAVLDDMKAKQINMVRKRPKNGRQQMAQTSAGVDDTSK